jgi:CRISPR/Cas system-associated protein Cas10 (large subunit of type III CRISPR-Cas system)
LSQLDTIRLCALLHDIGKLDCWAERKGWTKHTLYTYKFVRKCLGEELAEHAKRHHVGPSYSEEDRPLEDIERIVCLADSMAAGADRKEEPIHGAPVPSPPIELSHVLSRSVVRKRLSEADLAYLSQALAGKLGSLEMDFSVSPRDCYFRFFDVLEESGLHLVPADTREPINDVSLWDHLKLTAAFATCIYLSGGWKGYEPETYQFALISGDADKISNFINESLRLPDLNARSELIKQATDMARVFLRDFLGPECVLFAAGGSLLAIAPPTMAEEALKGVKKKFEDGTGGMVTITTSCVVKDGGEFQGNFGSVWEASQAKMRMEKSRRMLIPRFSVDEGVDVCDVCRKNPWSREDRLRSLALDASARFERLCDACWDLREKGKGVWLDDLRDRRNFVGCVMVDGDNIGSVLAGKAFLEQNKATTPSRVSTVSGLIHRVCEEDFRMVIGEFGGHSSIVFAGGDDLLAFVPGEVALDIAGKIALKFNDDMARVCTVSAGVSIFNYRLPVYVGLESARTLLRKAKDEGKNRVAFAVVGGSGVTESELQRVKSRSWSELKLLLGIARFMRESGIAASQLRHIASVSKDRDRAEALIKCLMGRGNVEWDKGIELLSHLESGLLADAFLVYNLFFKGD